MSYYLDLSTLNATTDPSDIIVYANLLTGGALGPLILAAFFFITLMGSFFAELRFSGRGKMSVSFAVAAYVTFGLSVIMMMKDGLLNPAYLFATIGLSLIGTAWILWPSEPQY
jgi:hypothetical protein